MWSEENDGFHINVVHECANIDSHCIYATHQGADSTIWGASMVIRDHRQTSVGCKENDGFHINVIHEWLIIDSYCIHATHQGVDPMILEASMVMRDHRHLYVKQRKWWLPYQCFLWLCNPWFTLFPCNALMSWCYRGFPHDVMMEDKQQQQNQYKFMQASFYVYCA